MIIRTYSVGLYNIKHIEVTVVVICNKIQLIMSLFFETVSFYQPLPRSFTLTQKSLTQTHTNTHPCCEHYPFSQKNDHAISASSLKLPLSADSVGPDSPSESV